MTPDPLDPLRTAIESRERAAEALRDAEQAVKVEVAAARSAGVRVADLARELEVDRQRIYQILREVN